jgi:hypothetical protein
LRKVAADATLDRPGGVDAAILTDPRGSVLPDSSRPQAIGVLATVSRDRSRANPEVVLDQLIS